MKPARQRLSKNQKGRPRSAAPTAFFVALITLPLGARDRRSSYT